MHNLCCHLKIHQALKFLSDKSRRHVERSFRALDLLLFSQHWLASVWIRPDHHVVVFQDSDLRSALLLEQAAHCFINMKQPMVRKYSFHMILAGHRFSKAGQVCWPFSSSPESDQQSVRKTMLDCTCGFCFQRRHALRSYSQALQVYKGKNWTLAEVSDFRWSSSSAPAIAPVVALFYTRRLPVCIIASDVRNLETGPSRSVLMSNKILLTVPSRLQPGHVPASTDVAFVQL